MRTFHRIMTSIAALLIGMAASAEMVAVTINEEQEDAIEMHKAKGAKVQVIKTHDRAYPTVIRATYKDGVATYLVTDAIATHKRRLRAQHRQPSQLLQLKHQLIQPQRHRKLRSLRKRQRKQPFQKTQLYRKHKKLRWYIPTALPGQETILTPSIKTRGTTL